MTVETLKSGKLELNFEMSICEKSGGNLVPQLLFIT